jgi:hypothetical protein
MFDVALSGGIAPTALDLGDTDDIRFQVEACDDEEISIRLSRQDLPHAGVNALRGNSQASSRSGSSAR